MTDREQFDRWLERELRQTRDIDVEAYKRRLREQEDAFSSLLGNSDTTLHFIHQREQDREIVEKFCAEMSARFKTREGG